MQVAKNHERRRVCYSDKSRTEIPNDAGSGIVIGSNCHDNSGRCVYTDLFAQCPTGLVGKCNGHDVGPAGHLSDCRVSLDIEMGGTACQILNQQVDHLICRNFVRRCA